jgi:hypothetical protein
VSVFVGADDWPLYAVALELESFTASLFSSRLVAVIITLITHTITNPATAAA